MNTEQVNDYLNKLKGNAVSEEPTTQEETDVTTEAPAEVNEPEAKVSEIEETVDGVEQPKEEAKSDGKDEQKPQEVKEEEPKAETPKEEHKKEEPQNRRDYAFERLKKKSKEEKKQLEARIKELEEELNKGKGLKAEHFIDKDGKPDPNGYVDWKFHEREMQDEVNELRRYERDRQLQEDIDEDRRRVENCYQDENERKEYETLIANNGKAFYDAVSDVDPNGVVFGYLSTMPEYPIVLKELMTDNKLLGYTFRSTDPEALKRNIAAVADTILERHHNKTPVIEKIETPVTPKQEPKKELPVIGKQINSTPGTANVVHDRNYWNRYLREHPRG